MPTDPNYSNPPSTFRGQYLNSAGTDTSSATSEEGSGQTLDLAWLIGVIRRRLGLMAIVTVLLSGATGSLIIWKAKETKKSFDGSFQVLVEPVTAEGRLAKLSLLAQTGTSVGAAELTKVGVDKADLVDYETQIRVLTSPKILTPVVGELQAQYPKITYPQLIGGLKLSRVSYVRDGKEVGTKILEVHYNDENPEKIQVVLDTLAKAYLQYSLQERLTSLRQGIQFIDEQLPELQQRVDTLERQLQKLREQYDLNFPQLTADGLAQQRNHVERQRIDLQAQLEEARATYRSRQQEIEAGNSLAILSRDPNNIYNSLIIQRYNVDAALALESSQFLENSPPIQVLREKQENLERLLLEEAQKAQRTLAAQITDLEARASYLAQTERRVKRRLDVFPGVLRRYSDLERNVAVATDSLKAFLEKREALKLDASQREVPWELISPPDLWRTPSGGLRVSSAVDVKRQVAIAVILSALVGIGVGFIAEIMDAVYHSPEELKGSTKLPLLGAIPFVKALEKYEKQARKLIARGKVEKNPYLLLPAPDYSPAYLEAFRSLYTNISLLGSRQRPIRSLVVGSATPNDGKSTIALQLAKTAASIGQRVLLVDADLRRPQLHLRLGLRNERGISDIIQNDLSLNDVIQQSPTESNLFVLSGGLVASDPIKLLSSPKMEHLMEQFQGFFDLTIYNTPPLVGLADANLLAANSDGIVLVVRLEKTNRALVAKALEGLKISGASVLGAIANGVQQEHHSGAELDYLRNYHQPLLAEQEALNSPKMYQQNVDRP